MKIQTWDILSDRSRSLYSRNKVVQILVQNTLTKRASENLGELLGLKGFTLQNLVGQKSDPRYSVSNSQVKYLTT